MKKHWNIEWCTVRQRSDQRRLYGLVLRALWMQLQPLEMKIVRILWASAQRSMWLVSPSSLQYSATAMDVLKIYPFSAVPNPSKLCGRRTGRCWWTSTVSSHHPSAKFPFCIQCFPDFAQIHCVPESPTGRLSSSERAEHRHVAELEGAEQLDKIKRVGQGIWKQMWRWQLLQFDSPWRE